MTPIQKFRFVIIAIVFGCVFAISYGHITEVAARYGNTWPAWLYPICIDGLIVASALTLIGRNGVSKGARFYARGGRWFGFAATIYANVAHSGYASTDAILVNLIPAISLILISELAIHGAAGTAKYGIGRKPKTTQPQTSGRSLRPVA